MTLRRFLPAGLFLLAIGATSVVLLSGLLTSQAIQNPSISLDMVPAGNSYDDTTNTMTVGSIDNCLSSPTANPATHSHTAQFIIRNVEDLVGWQARMNYIGDQFRPNVVNFTPFADLTTGQSVSFVNLPIDPSTLLHRDVITASSIPPAATGPQTALIGSVYQGAQAFPISPDSPAKAVPDDTSYGAPSGGVLASIALQVVGDESGQASLLIDVDDNNPNPPGSTVEVFTGTGLQTINLTPGALGDGLHAEGASCGAPSPCPTPGPTAPPINISDETFTNQLGQAVNGLHARYTGPVGGCVLSNAPGCASPLFSVGGSNEYFINWPTTCVDVGESVTVRVTSEPPASRVCAEWTHNGGVIGPAAPPQPICGTPTPRVTPGTITPTPSPTATPTPTPNLTGHDARLTRISGVPKNVRLSPGEVIADNANVVVANESDHPDTIGVYVDVLAPSGCTPNGRVLQTTVTLGAGNKTTIPVPVSYSCADVNAANGQSYTWTAVADHGADDLASCGTGSLQSLGCFNALADDDEDPADNRVSRTGPKVIAQ